MMEVGTQVELLVPCLGCDVGTIGVVYNSYQDHTDENRFGVQIIFENGEHDGFSYQEQQSFVRLVGHDVKNMNYEFKNVMRVSEDYRNGVFNFRVNRQLLRKQKLMKLNGKNKFS